VSIPDHLDWRACLKWLEEVMEADEVGHALDLPLDELYAIQPDDPHYQLAPAVARAIIRLAAEQRALLEGEVFSP